MCHGDGELVVVEWLWIHMVTTAGRNTPVGAPNICHVEDDCDATWKF
jgi:hypothetical protein